MRQDKKHKSAATGWLFAALRETRQRCEALFDQQMWCWGCDVRREAGNLLLAYGMEKWPSPVPRLRSAYTMPLDAESAITLWGWGVWTAAQGHGSIFISRAHFAVRYRSSAELRPAAWCEAQLPAFETPISEEQHPHIIHLLGKTFDWIADYERWLQETVGTDYREQATAVWPQRKRYRGGVPVNEITGAWDRLARHGQNMATR